jgi:hypothetical protein
VKKTNVCDFPAFVSFLGLGLICHSLHSFLELLLVEKIIVLQWGKVAVKLED